jgi:single-stranded-DNA-specific exonuclease
MLEQALAIVGDLREAAGESRSVFYHPQWHQGVVGIVASRLKDRLHRPVICFAPAEEKGAAALRGSGRSIPALHLRDCLDLVSKRAPGLIRRFGGHSQAAGLTLAESDLDAFSREFERALAEMLPAEARARTIETDGSLDAPQLTLDTARLLESQIWGQGFPQPLFCDTFAVEAQRVVGERHLKLQLKKDGRRFEAMCFQAVEKHGDRPAVANAGGQIKAVYRLAVHEFNGLKNVQINVEHFE